MSITRKILVACLAGIVPLMAVGWFAVQRANDAMAEEVRSGLARVADLEKSGVEAELRAMDDRLAAATDRPSPLVAATSAYLARPDTDQAAAVADVLARMTWSVPDLRAASVFDLSGSLIADTRTSADQPPRTVPAPLLAAGRTAPTMGRAFRTLDGEDRRYQLARPLRSDGLPIGVLVAEADLAPVVRPLAGDATLGDSVEAAIVQAKDDGSAEFISDLRFERNAAFRHTIDRSETTSAAIVAINGAQAEHDGLHDYRDEPVVAAFRSIDGTDWALVVKIDRSEAYASARELASLLRVAALVAGAALALVSIALARSIIRRVRRVTAMAEAISRGDLTLRVDDRSRDELGRLSRAFDLMADHLAADIAERERVEAMLEHQARHDALTGLPNRAPAYERLTLALAGGPERGMVGLLFCDLDAFKAVNDELGHSAGDELLQQVAARLQHVVGDEHTIARFGGDEFVLVCEGLTHLDEVEALAARLRAAVVEPFIVQGREVVTTMSIGSVIAAPGDEVTPESLVRDADAAMYRAKELGRDRHVPLDDEIRLRASTRFSATMNVRRAIEEQRLEVWYQPIVDLVGGRTVGVEALLRLPPGMGSPLAPSGLVELAEQAGLGVALDRWVLETACLQLRRWADEGHDELTMAVNVSGTMVGDAGLVDAVSEVIDATGIVPGRLCVEVTEVAFRGDDDGAARALERLRRAGVRVAIDDFGTGYSSLDRLRRLPVNALKVDRTFVRDVDVDPAARAIVGSVLGLGSTLGMDVVAEGVERESQHRVLRELGCRAGQGWYYAKARPAAEVAELVAVPLLGGVDREDLVPAVGFGRR
jgi:diguanylate cyclase (GGDEF)-like protein